ncbi:MAG: hypothetical protein M0P12_03025 [Paludibacteraceae bacterium]|nr:hypothetical protein [Paludibacteraceae bacterium]
MNLKRDNWTNDEVIKLLASIIIAAPSCEFASNWNDAINQCRYLFYDMKVDPEKVAGAKALDTDTGRIVCVGPKLPQ